MRKLNRLLSFSLSFSFCLSASLFLSLLLLLPLSLFLCFFFHLPDTASANFFSFILLIKSSPFLVSLCISCSIRCAHASGIGVVRYVRTLLIIRRNKKSYRKPMCARSWGFATNQRRVSTCICVRRNFCSKKNERGCRFSEGEREREREIISFILLMSDKATSYDSTRHPRICPERLAKCRVKRPEHISRILRCFALSGLDSVRNDSKRY